MFNDKEIKEIDCLGEICPIPIMKLQSKLEEVKNGEIYMLITDHSCALGSVSDFCSKHNLAYSPTEVMNGVWEIVISK